MKASRDEVRRAVWAALDFCGSIFGAAKQIADDYHEPMDQEYEDAIFEAATEYTEKFGPGGTEWE